MDRSEAISLVVRYGLLIVIGVANLILAEKGLFYLIFTPLTINPAFWAFHWLYNAALISPNVIFFKGYYASIIPACVAGSAYFLLLILNLTTPMNRSQRIKNLVYIFTAFLIVNVARIIFFGTLLSKGYQYFDIAHIATWYIGSTLLVALIWFTSVKLFNIKNIPIYSDINGLVQDAQRTSTQN